MAKTPEQFCEEMKKIHPTIEVIGSYTKAVEPVLVRCLVCGKEWSPKAYSLLSGKGCPHCSAIKGARNNKGKTGLKDHATFVDQMKLKHPSVKVLGDYTSTHTDIECQCELCGHKWIAKPYSLLQGHGCPRCAKSGTSFMEQLMYLSCCAAFGEDKVHSRDRKTIGMELDIVVPDYKFAIEPGNWFLHKKSITRDSKKRENCQKKGYRLITVYDKYPIDEEPPFNTDCYVFSEDLNIADHALIRKLIVEILKSVGFQIEVDAFDWNSLEQQAYENAKAKTHDDFIEEMKKAMPSIEVLGKYVNANRRVRVKCKKCGFEWDAIPANIVRGDGCRKCGAQVRGEKERRKQEDFENELKALIPSVKVVGKYISRHKAIEVKCLKCGNVWKTTPGSLLRKDRNLADNNGCPVCAKSKMGTPRKRVLNIDTGEIFESAVEAGKKYNTVPSAIRQCCRGINSTSNGYHWKYTD